MASFMRLYDQFVELGKLGKWFGLEKAILNSLKALTKLFFQPSWRRPAKNSKRQTMRVTYSFSLMFQFHCFYSYLISKLEEQFYF